MDHLSSTTSMARLGAVGGALFALGNLLHPLEHGDAAERSATWVAAHVTFAVGAILVCAGLPTMTRGMAAHSRVARIGTALTWLAMLFVPIGAYFEVYVAPELSDAATEDIEARALAFGLVQLVTFVLGPILLGVAGFLTRSWPVAARVGLIAAPLLLLLAPGLPGVDGVWLIAGTAALGLSLAAVGIAGARSHDASELPRSKAGQAVA